RRNRRPWGLLFPHYALFRDELRKIRLDEPHLLDRQRFAFGERPNVRCFSGVVANVRMSAFGPKQTSHFACTCLLSGVKRTSLFAARTSASDPKRTKRMP